ncbi:hypothetical protein HXY33_08525 [Candidatus Bathyarchaeota archaeon]|nr:hypothetical protein [Candidatus Bathyarchaeota archaeon]
MPVPSALVARYFQLLVYRQFTEAERELERLKQKMHKTEWNRGYFRALYGMMLARRSNNNDSYTFFSKLDLNDKTVLHNYKREFSEHVKNRLHGDFDRGFFSAWSDCMRVLNRMDLSNVPATNGASTALAKKLETVEADKNQATIQDFFEEEKA